MAKQHIIKQYDQNRVHEHSTTLKLPSDKTAYYKIACSTPQHSTTSKLSSDNTACDKIAHNETAQHQNGTATKGHGVEQYSNEAELVYFVNDQFIAEHIEEKCDRVYSPQSAGKACA